MKIIPEDDARGFFFAEADTVTKSNLTGKRVDVMRIHARAMARRTILMVIPILLILLTITMSPGAAEDGGDSTTKERQEFVEGAKEVGGLNDEEVERVLENPELMDSVPVGMEVFSETFDESGVSSGYQMQAASAAQCKRKVMTLQYLDANSQPLLRFIATKVWCFNGNIITSSNMRDVETWVRPDSRHSLESGGWRYDETSEYGTEKYAAFKGYPRGSHVSTRAGRFEYVFPGETNPSSVIWPAARQRGFSNGACHSVQYEAVQPIVHTGPPVQDNSPTATFTFSSKYQGSTFQCSLDGGAFVNCNSPKTYTGLGEGIHSFQIQARNGAGYALPRPVTYRWMVEMTAPQIESVSPQDDATGVATNTNVEATFSKEVDAFTLIGNFTVVETVSGNVVRSSLSYDPGTSTATLDPNADLAPGVTYTATIQGGEDGAKDKAGNPLPEDKIWSFTVAE